MPTPNEIARIADAINGLRPDWPVNSLKTWITRNLGDRPYRDLAVALTWVACDANTAGPARVLEWGEWWAATRTYRAGPGSIAGPCPDHPDDPAQTATKCARCTAELVPMPERFADELAAAGVILSRRELFTHTFQGAPE